MHLYGWVPLCPPETITISLMGHTPKSLIKRKNYRASHADRAEADKLLQKKKKYSFVVGRTVTEWRGEKCLRLLLDFTVVLLSKQCQYWRFADEETG